MLSDIELSFVVEQAVEHIRRFSHTGGNDLHIERAMLVRHMGIEGNAGFASIIRVAMGCQ